MNIQRINALTKKDLLTVIRVPAVLFMAILFPIVLTGAFGIAFGSFGGVASETSYTVGIIDSDGSKWSEYFLNNISSSEVLRNISYTDYDNAQDDLSQGIISAIIIIPENFGSSCDSFFLNPLNASLWINTTIDLTVDQSSLIVSNAVPPLIQQLLMITIYGEDAISSPQPVQIGNPSFVQSEHLTQFDIMAPGMFAFAVIFLTMIVSESFTESREKGLLRRIQVTPTSSVDIILSSVISNMIIAVFQVALVFVVAGIMGFNPKTDLVGILFAFVLVLILALCNVAFGLITASIAKTPSAATGISFIFILPQMFLGTFVPIAGDIQKIVPSYYTTHGLTSVLLRGAPITGETVVMDLIVLACFGIVSIILGVIFYSRFGKD
ncbi:MAG: ABC transporter permease [Candidatus Hodarchaeales archaeon]|jgi:ABC-2 type transport system permease protein